MKRAVFSLLLLLLLVLLVPTTGFAAGGTVTINYNNGGTISPTTSVKMEGNIIYVEDDSLIELAVTPNDGYQIRGIYLNDQSLGISGSGTKTVSIEPRGESVFLRVTFVRKEVADDFPESPQIPEETSPPPTSDPQPEITEPPQSSQTPQDPPSNDTPSSPPTAQPGRPSPESPPAAGTQDTAPMETDPPDSSPPDRLPTYEPGSTTSTSEETISGEIQNGGVGDIAHEETPVFFSLQTLTVIGIILCAVVIAVIVIAHLLKSAKKRL